MVTGGYLQPVFYRETFKKKISLAARRLKHFEFDFVACSGLSGAIFASVLCEKMDKSLIVVRKGESSHSMHKVEGLPEHGKHKYIIVDDFIASGRTIKHITDNIELNNYFNATLNLQFIYLYNEEASSFKRFFTYGDQKVVVNPKPPTTLEPTVIKEPKVSANLRNKRSLGGYFGYEIS